MLLAPLGQSRTSTSANSMLRTLERRRQQFHATRTWSNYNLAFVCTTARQSINAADASKATRSTMSTGGGCLVVGHVQLLYDLTWQRIAHRPWQIHAGDGDGRACGLISCIVTVADASPPAPPSWPAAPLVDQLMFSRALVLAPAPLFVYSRMPGRPRGMACSGTAYSPTPAQRFFFSSHSPLVSRISYPTVCASLDA